MSEQGKNNDFAKIFNGVYVSVVSHDKLRQADVNVQQALVSIQEALHFSKPDFLPMADISEDDLELAMVHYDSIVELVDDFYNDPEIESLDQISQGLGEFSTGNHNVTVDIDPVLKRDFIENASVFTEVKRRMDHVKNTIAYAGVGEDKAELASDLAMVVEDLNQAYEGVKPVYRHDDKTLLGVHSASRPEDLSF